MVAFRLPIWNETVRPSESMVRNDWRPADEVVVVVVGAGGVLTEVARDVAVRLAALGEGEAEAMLEEGALPRLLAGPRGLRAVARAPLVAAIHAVAALVVAEPRVAEIDVNPLIAAGADVIAVDALVITADA